MAVTAATQFNFTYMYMTYSCISEQKEYQTFSPSLLSAKSVH